MGKGGEEGEGRGGEGRRREGRAGEGNFASAPSKYIWIDAAASEIRTSRTNQFIPNRTTLNLINLKAFCNCIERVEPEIHFTVLIMFTCTLYR